MNSRTMVRRLRAWHLGEPLTRGTTIHHDVADAKHRLLMTFVKMGGETRPWGIGWKEGSKKAQFRVVPEPRFRAGVDEMAAAFGPVIARHLHHPDFGTSASDPAGLAPLRQIWLPNPSHVAMLHHFGYAYARRQVDRPFAQELRLLGRASLFAFLEAQQPGQQLVMTATQALRSAYDFPAEDVRQGHLGFLLAWLEHRGNREQGLAAALEAEKHSIATALTPSLERGELGDLVEAYNAARRAEQTKEMSRLAGLIESILKPELERRLDLTEEAIKMIEDDPREYNSGVDELVSTTLASQFYGWFVNEQNAIARGTEPFVPSPETDFQTRGSSTRYFRAQAAAERQFNALIHDDRELEAEAISTGRAFRGTIVRVGDEGTGKKTIPVWHVEDPSPGPLSIRSGDSVCVVGCAKRSGRVRHIEATRGGGLVLELEIDNCKTAIKGPTWPMSMHGADERWIGQVVTLIGTSFAQMTERKAELARNRDSQPGDWILASPTVEAVAESGDAVAEVETDDAA